MQGLTWQSSLDCEDRAARFPDTEVFGSRVTSSAQVADLAEQPPLVVHGRLGTRYQLDDEFVTASGNSKGRTGFPGQRLIHDQHAVDASQSRHRVQQLPIRLT